MQAAIGSVGQALLTPFRGEELALGHEISSDDDLAIDASVRSTAIRLITLGTCRLGADELLVVDGALQVRGVDALRVIGASIMPAIVSGNASVPTMMIAEKAAAAILADYHS